MKVPPTTTVVVHLFLLLHHQLPEKVSYPFLQTEEDDLRTSSHDDAEAVAVAEASTCRVVSLKGKIGYHLSGHRWNRYGSFFVDAETDPVVMDVGFHLAISLVLLVEEEEVEEDELRNRWCWMFWKLYRRCYDHERGNWSLHG